MDFNSRKTLGILGLASGLAVVRLLAALPSRSGTVYHFRDRVWEGIAWGVGISSGAIAGMNILIRGSEELYRRRDSSSTRGEDNGG